MLIETLWRIMSRVAKTVRGDELTRAFAWSIQWLFRWELPCWTPELWWVVPFTILLATATCTSGHC